MQHYICTHGKRIDLTQEGEVAGFHAGDRVEYTARCFKALRGKRATVVGFGLERRI